MPFTAAAAPGVKLLFVFCLLAAAEPVLLVGLSVNEDDDWAPIGVVGVCVPFADGPAEDRDGRFWLLPLAIGVLRLVDKLSINLPLTTRLSLDFRKSFVIISEKVSVTASTLSIVTRPTVTASVEVDNASNSNVHHPKEALVLLLELFLVEYLDGEYALLIHAPVRTSVSAAAVPQMSLQHTYQSSRSSRG